MNNVVNGNGINVDGLRPVPGILNFYGTKAPGDHLVEGLEGRPRSAAENSHTASELVGHDFRRTAEVRPACSGCFYWSHVNRS
jgi:hypothetical protein